LHTLNIQRDGMVNKVTVQL